MYNTTIKGTHQLDKKWGQSSFYLDIWSQDSLKRPYQQQPVIPSVP